MSRADEQTSKRCANCGFYEVHATAHAPQCMDCDRSTNSERYEWLREHPAWETEAFLGGLTPEQFDEAVDKERKR